MKHSPVKRTHRELAYEIILWDTAMADLEPWLETGYDTRHIPQHGIDGAQLIANFEARLLAGLLEIHQDDLRAYLSRQVDRLEQEIKALSTSGAAHACVAIGGNDCRYCPICDKDMPPLFVFWDQDSIWVVARDAEDAALVYAEHIGDPSDGRAFERFPDGQEITIRVWVSGKQMGKIAPVDEEDGTDAIESHRQPACVWASRNGRGFLCTTES